jgi:4'-phosphopantetheinyl transferase
MTAINLNINFVDHVNWQSANLCGFGINGQVDIWKVSVIANLSSLNDFISVLSPDEILRANRYLRREDRDRFAISRGVLRYILSKYLAIQPEVIRFEFGSNKKPFVTFPAEYILHYNLSDSEDSILIAFAASPVGIDVEYIKPKFYYDSILPLNFSRPEIDYINGEDQLQRFFMLWTRKEAILKATGIGLTDHLKLIPALAGKYTIDGDLLATETHWHLTSFISSPDYIATIAAGPRINTYNFYEFNFEESFI